MKLTSLEAILAALNQYAVHYLIVGGLAVTAHGYGRLTIDVDLVIQLQTSNVRQALEALTSLGYQPVAPVSAEQFADPAIRERWIREKNMVVLGLHSPQHPETPLIFSRQNPSISTRSIGVRWWERSRRASWLGLSVSTPAFG